MGHSIAYQLIINDFPLNPFQYHISHLLFMVIINEKCSQVEFHTQEMRISIKALISNHVGTNLWMKCYVGRANSSLSIKGTVEAQ